MTIEDKRELLEAVGYHFDSRYNGWVVEVEVSTPAEFVYGERWKGVHTAEGVEKCKGRLLANVINKAMIHFESEMAGEEMLEQATREIVNIDYKTFSHLSDKERFVAITKWIGLPRYIDMMVLDETDRQWYIAQFESENTNEAD
jgi:hypothetical protein